MGAVGSKSKDPKPYPFPFPQHPPGPYNYPQNYQALPPWAPGPWQGHYDDKYMSMMGINPSQHRRKKKKGKAPMMNPGMGMGWAQGYAPFPYPNTGYPMPPYVPAMMPGMPAGQVIPMPMPMPMPMPQAASSAAPASNAAPVIPTGIVPSQPTQQPVIPNISAAPPLQAQAAIAQPPPPPLFTPGEGAPLRSFPGAELTSPPQPPRRSQTPFHRRPSGDDSTNTSDDDPPRPAGGVPPPPILNNSRQHGGDLQRSMSAHEPRSPPHSRAPNHSENIAAILGSHTPPQPGVFGPPGGRPRTPISNPLPPPPKDLYESSPYKTLLNLPQTTTLLSAAYGGASGGVANAAAGTSTSGAPVIPGADLPRSHTEAKKKGKGFGLFRSFTSGGRRRHMDMPVPSTAAAGASAGPSGSRQGAGFVPVFAPANTASSHARRASVDSRSPVVHTGPSPDDLTRGPPATTAIPPNPVPGSHIPTLDPSLPPVRFTQSSPLAGFLNHSPHRVLYQNKTYPSATHLFEAMKYLEGPPGQPARPELAERIRVCENVADVYPLSADFQAKGWVRSDWGSVFNACMDEVLYNKFKQHPDLRNNLMHTGMAPIVYEDPTDEYWGDGPNGEGANELGLALVRVRARLRAEGYGI